jgi:hypothetical protein
MALPITVPYTFGNATTAIPLSNLDSDYATVYQAVNGIGNGSVALANVSITGGTINVANVTGIQPSTPYTANGVVYASSTSALATGSALTFNGSSTTPLVAVASTSTAASSQNFTTNSAAQRTTIGVEQSTGGGLFVGSSAYAAVFGSAGASSTQFASNNNVRMTIDSSGYVGIAETSPATYGAFAVRKAVTTGNSTNCSASFSDAANSTLDISHPSGNLVYLNAQNAALAFGAGSAERTRIDTNGNLLVGSTYGGFNARQLLQFSASGTSTVGLVVSCSASGTGQKFIQFVNLGTESGSITQSSTGVLYNVTSDQRLKTNIVDAPDGNIDQIKIRSFDWKSDGTHNTYGVIAQELVEVAPYAVHQPANPDEMMGVDYSKLVPMMIKEIQQLKAEVAKLKGA